MRTRRGPDGVHIFDRRTGVNLLLDEIGCAEADWARAPRQVSIALTNACDLQCPYCYAPKHAAVLPADRLRGWVDELDFAGSLGIGFGGGEPTLYRRLPEVCRYITEQTELAVTLTTHAHRWTPRLNEVLVDSVHFVRVSVDGTGQVYESLRGRSFDDLCGRLGLIGQAFRLGLNCVVNSSTLPVLDDVAELAASVGAEELLLLPERATPGMPGIADSDLAAMYGWINSHQGPVALAISEADTGDLATANALRKETGLRSYAHIDASGVVRRNSYASAGEIITDTGLLDALDRLQERAVA